MARRVIESHHGHLLIMIKSQSYVLLSKILKLRWKENLSSLWTPCTASPEQPATGPDHLAEVPCVTIILIITVITVTMIVVNTNSFIIFIIMMHAACPNHLADLYLVNSSLSGSRIVRSHCTRGTPAVHHQAPGDDEIVKTFPTWRLTNLIL